MAQLCPGAVLTKLDKLVEPLKMTVTTKVKANAVKQEYEKHDELKRSAMRAVAALMQIPGAGKNLSERGAGAGRQREGEYTTLIKIINSQHELQRPVKKKLNCSFIREVLESLAVIINRKKKQFSLLTPDLALAPPSPSNVATF